MDLLVWARYVQAISTGKRLLDLTQYAGGVLLDPCLQNRLAEGRFDVVKVTRQQRRHLTNATFGSPGLPVNETGPILFFYGVPLWAI